MQTIEAQKKTIIRLGGRNPAVDQQRRALLRRLDREMQRDLNECETLLRELYVLCLDKLHRRLIRGNIDLSNYYRETQVIANCAEQLNSLAEEQ